jgi:hypothetical protein
MKGLENFYFKGCLTSRFKNSESLDQFNNTLEQIFNNDLKEGYFLKSKYPFSKDLRPQAYDYDRSILDVLFDSDIPGVIKNALGYDLYLAHIQIRISELFPPGQEERSYMEWHRDTHFYDGKMHGSAPPVYKLIYYPQLNKEEERPLATAPGSHLRILPSISQDHSQLNSSEILVKTTSMDEFLFFNTSLLHSTLPAHKNGTLRIIYNFCLDSQLSNYKEQSELHKIYKERLKND